MIAQKVASLRAEADQNMKRADDAELALKQANQQVSD